VAKWSLAQQSFAALRPAPEWCHIRLRPCLIEKDELRRINPMAMFQPSGSLVCDVEPVLLAGDQCLFL
jgi:hypothetical protein